ncbi:hypothetical protein VPHD479_0329 [Vibrio phage D479]
MDINIVVDNEFVQPTDAPTLFDDVPLTIIPASFTMTDLVVELGLFKSKSQARKAGRVGPIPTGWSELKGNKKTFLFVWNPTE